MIKADEQILKTDTRGRVRTSVVRRQQLLEEFERSGLSGIKFAALAGIKYPTFAVWVKRRRQQGANQPNLPAKPADSMRWLEAVVEQAQSPGAQNPGGIVLELAGGARLQINHVNQVALAAALVRALEKSC
jgi:hypothetical protein